MNTTTAQVVKLLLSDRRTDSVKLADSQVSLFWICDTKITYQDYKLLVRNTVVDTARLSNRSKWLYGKSSDNVADMGTR